MMKKNKPMVLLLVCILTFAGVSISYSTNTNNPQVAGEQLRDLGILRGYDDGTLRLDRNITRAEFATLVVRMMSLEERANARRGRTPFRDVASDFWASGFINVAVEEKLIKGYEDNTFKPQANITYAEAITILIRLLGYESQVTGTWPRGHMTMANQLGITRTTNHPANHIVTRGDVALLIVQALAVEIR